MKFSLIAAALATLTLAAPLQRRQCYIDRDGEKYCIDDPVCHRLDTGAVVCIAQRTDDASNDLAKRQCYVDRNGQSICNDKPRCYTEPDGTKVCVM